MLDAEHLDPQPLGVRGHDQFLADAPILLAADQNLAGHQIQRFAGIVRDQEVIDVGGNKIVTGVRRVDPPFAADLVEILGLARCRCLVGGNLRLALIVWDEQVLEILRRFLFGIGEGIFGLRDASSAASAIERSESPGSPKGSSTRSSGSTPTSEITTSPDFNPSASVIRRSSSRGTVELTGKIVRFFSRTGSQTISSEESGAAIFAAGPGAFFTHAPLPSPNRRRHDCHAHRPLDSCCAYKSSLFPSGLPRSGKPHPSDEAAANANRSRERLKFTPRPTRG